MKTFFRTMTAAAAMAACVLCAPAQAGVLADLNSVFMSNATAGGTFTTRDRVGIFGGSVEIRTPVQSVTLVAFDPPRYAASCGGVSLSLGSFSFVSSEQLVAVFRQVAANAVGLAFRAAIKSISPSLDALISEFQALLQNMNNMAKNSCHFAQLLVDKSGVANALDGEGAQASALSGYVNDIAGTWTKYLSQANDYMRGQSANNPRAGNQLAKALVASGATGVVGMAGLANVDGSTNDPTNPNDLNNRLIMSILGYAIDATVCAGLNANGAATTSGSSLGDGSPGRIECNGAQLVSLQDLVEGGGTGSMRPGAPLQLYRCMDPNGSVTGGTDKQPCTVMKKETFNYQGIRGWVNTMLFGNADGIWDNGSTEGRDSIVGKFNSYTDVQLSATQRAFIKQAGNGLLPILASTNDPYARASYARQLTQGIVSCMTSKVGSAIWIGMRGAYHDNSYKMSEAQKANFEAFRSELATRQQACDTDDSLLRFASTQAALIRLPSTTR
jgi:conjugative transfer pilus assembly protein TraH